MRALIGPDLLRKLPGHNVDIRDTKLIGYVLRVRASGAHAYLVNLGRRRWTTIGRVGDITPETARLTADALLGSVSRDTLKLMSEDPTLNLRAAQARARGELSGPRGNRRARWQQFLTDQYEPWAIQHRKTGAETVAILRRQFSAFDHLRLPEISAFAIERWRSGRLKSGTKPATVNRNLVALRGALTKALEWKTGGLKVHPMATVKQSKVDTVGRLRYLTDDEEARLLATLAERDTRRRVERESANAWRRVRGYDELPAMGTYTDHLTPLVIVALHTGCRRGELFGLTWADVDPTGAQLTVRSDSAKSGCARVVPLNSVVVSTLRKWQPADVERTAYVFPGDDGEPLDDVKSGWLRLLRDAEIPRFRFHDLRHTFASKLVQAGVDLNTVRELLGHADLKMTIRYAHLAPEHRAAAVAKLVRA